MFEELRKLIEQHDSIVIFGHPYPDGDCYGSQIGLRDALRLNYPNKKVYAVGSGLRRYFDFISRMDVVDDEVIKNSLAVLVDGNDVSRMEDQRVTTAKAFMKIDHHMENGKFTEGPFVLDTNANSACELIVQFIRESGWKVNPTICNALFCVRKRLVKNCGIVMESLALMENLRSLGATNIHALMVPASRPTAIHTFPTPAR